MEERHIYRNDPIEEALCELRFESDKEWNLTFPGRFYEQIKDVYDGKPRQQNLMEAGFQTETQPEGTALQLKGSFAKVQFPTQDDKKLVAIGPDVLSIHVLAPYPNWEDFYPRIQRAFQEYLKVGASAGRGPLNPIDLSRELAHIGGELPLFTEMPRVTILGESRLWRVERTFSFSSIDDLPE